MFSLHPEKYIHFYLKKNHKINQWTDKSHCCNIRPYFPLSHSRATNRRYQSSTRNGKPYKVTRQGKCEQIANTWNQKTYIFRFAVYELDPPDVPWIFSQ